MRKSLAVLAIVALTKIPSVSAQKSEIISIDDDWILLCASLSSAQILYSLLASNRPLENIDDCWKVEGPMEIIVLQEGHRFSSITYRTRTTEDDVALAVSEGRTELAKKLRHELENNIWSRWYRSPAWAFTSWLHE